MLLLLETLKKRETDALRKRFAHSKETEEQRPKRIEKAFFYREKYVMNSEIKCQRRHNQYKKILKKNVRGCVMYTKKI